MRCLGTFTRKFKRTISNSIFQKLIDDFLHIGEEINCEDVNADNIFSDFFTQNAPFKGYKNEFKDTFIACSLLSWSECNDIEKITIISGNRKDWEPICSRDDFCQKFVYYQSIDKYLDEYKELEEEACRIISNTILKNAPSKIASLFKDIWFTLPMELLSVDENEPSLIDNSVKVIINKNSICVVDKDEEYDEISFDGEIEYKVEIDTAAPETGMLSDGDIVYYYDKIEGELKARHCFSSYATIYKEDGRYIIGDINADLPNSIEVPWDDEFNTSPDVFIDFTPY